MKRIISTFLLILTLISASAISVFAFQYVNGCENKEGVNESLFNDKGREIKEIYGIDVIFLNVPDDVKTNEAAKEFIDTENLTDSYLIFVNNTENYVLFCSDDLDEIFDENTLDKVADLSFYESYYTNQIISQYYSAVKDVLRSSELHKRPSTDIHTEYKYMVDTADVLTDEEEKAINEKLEKLREENKLDLVIVTVNGIMSDERMYYADDYYDYNSYGYGKNKDGALLLVNIHEDGTYTKNNSWISTCGAAIKYISDDDIQEIGSELTPLLTNGKYGEAFELFADLAIDCVNKSKAFGTFIFMLTLLIFGVIFAFIRLSVLKGKHKSVYAAAEANNYIAEGTLHISKQYDNFLYSTVTVTERKSSSSDSSTHTSSSGTTHGGGGF